MVEVRSLCLRHILSGCIAHTAALSVQVSMHTDTPVMPNRHAMRKCKNRKKEKIMLVGKSLKKLLGKLCTWLHISDQGIRGIKGIRPLLSISNCSSTSRLPTSTFCERQPVPARRISTAGPKLPFRLSAITQCCDMRLVAWTLETAKEKKCTLFSDHDKSLIRRQPGAMTLGHSPKKSGACRLS